MRTIYNTSFIIDEAMESEWITFVKEQYLQTLRENQLCEDVIFTKVSIDQAEGKTYSLQVVFNSIEQEEHFLKDWLPGIEAKISEHYAGRYLYFSSVLTEI
ncbi:MAG: DUF4286 family protein [Odoribacter sp.]